ncbi:MAG TPA: carboxypeptidase regulatory-like domain-containing protein [Gemmatimonadaceae bacterium]|nr:carboxypeptidase regulatory-like domain-containing protein [Gemmatimonadaceae bacterium]
MWRLAAALLLLPSLAAAQGGAEIIRGHVATSDHRPVPNAIVTVTGLESRTTRTAHTNDKGSYTVLFGEGEREYVVTARSMGFTPGTVRALRLGESNIIVADVVLEHTPVQLDSVTVVGSRSAPSAAAEHPDIGGHEEDVTQGALFSLDPSDLNALAAQVPGVMAIAGVDGGPDGFSVLGASPDQNNVQLDGSTFGGRSLPPDAIAGAHLATTTFDPSRGNFAGGQLNLTSRRGNDLFQASGRIGLADPHLAWADPAAPTPVSRNLTMSGGVSGPLERGLAYFNLSFSNTVNTSDLLSLSSIDGRRLDLYGLSRDTIDALAGTLGTLGVPLTTSDIPDKNTGTNRSAFLRVDLSPAATTSLIITGNAGQYDQAGSGISPTSFPSLGTSNRSHNYGLQVSASGYVHGLIDELKTSVQGSSSNSGPFVSLPHGNVRVGSSFTDGRTGLTSLSFGGSMGGTNSNRSRSWETSNELSWITASSRHRVKFGQSIRWEWNDTKNAANPFGTFSFQSLDDLAGNHPASYSRTLSASQRSTKSVIGAMWVGGESRLSGQALQLQYGFRLDMAHPGTTPAYNPTVDSLFGRRTDDVPQDVGLSPRLGFTWTPHPMQPGRWDGRHMPFTISGGIGAFHGVIPPSRIAALVDQTGLPNTVRQLTCVGDATPTPDWSSYATDVTSAPDACLDGTAPVEFSTNEPSVGVFDPSFQAPTSWRGNVQMSGMTVKGWPLSASVQYSLGVNGESGIDLNLRRTPAFSLPGEQDRPVYVAPEAIVPATGAIAPGASRVSDRFASVTNYMSDLKSSTTQLQFGISPPEPLFGRFPLQLTYTFTHGRAQQRGFDGSTAGDPFVREWSGSSMTATHQFMLSTYIGGSGWVNLNLRATLSSGVPYTPMVAGDVNGDGRMDDRAFIFDPATTGDPVLAAQMDSLLAAAPSRSRACLAAQLGRIAERNSCHTSWRLQPDINLGLNLPWLNTGLGTFGDHLHISVTTVNAMGALLRLLNLENSALGQVTGAGYPVDPNLLYVTGFDPSTRRFDYRVNQQFGENRARRAGSGRFGAPFQIQIGAEVKVGGPPQRSLARQLGLVRAKKGGAPLSEAEVEARLRTLVSDPVTPILAMRDSLLLTEKQVGSITAIQSAFKATSDTLLKPLVDYVTSHAGKVKDGDLQKRIGKVMPKMRRAMTEAARSAAAVLDAEQQKRLPPYLKWLTGSSGGTRK